MSSVLAVTEISAHADTPPAGASSLARPRAPLRRMAWGGSAGLSPLSAGLLALATILVTPTMGQANSAAKAEPSRAGATQPSAPQAAPEDLEKTLSRLQATYGKFETWRADFTQTVKASALARPRVDTGVVELKKGGKMFWEFKTPELRHFISDGKTLWIYTPADKQALQSPLGQDASRTALNFMAGLGDVRRDFTAALARESELQRPDATPVHLTPKEQIGTLKRLTILVSKTDGLVREAWIQDQLGSSTRLEFLNVQLNKPIADARFTFTAPKGVQVMGSPF